MKERTPTPWKYLGQTNVGHRTYALEVGASTVYFQKEADAVYTYRAVNTHEDLLQALRRAVEFFDANGGEGDYSWLPLMKQAITRAEGGL